jgi:hypothetical protein
MGQAQHYAPGRIDRKKSEIRMFRPARLDRLAAASNTTRFKSTKRWGARKWNEARLLKGW